VTSRILVSLRVAATPERAFEMFTREIGLWWRPNTLFRFTPRSPGVLAMGSGLGGAVTETLPDGKVFEIGRITAWEPGARLAFTWRQATFPRGQVTEVEVLFERVGTATRVMWSIAAGTACPRTMSPATASPRRSSSGSMVNGGRSFCGPYASRAEREAEAAPDP
jgi:uncharacterized protein YndB with AHSA1/START domain